ncbi:MAG: universal stress protein [Atopostipes sp.]|nr:universal stress protein [Atopostipes sp.]
MEKRRKKILVAVDGSDNSKRALSEAKRYAQMTEAEVTILTVLEHTFALHYSSPSDSVDNGELNREEAGQAILKEALTFFQDFEGEVHTSLRNGYPASELLEEADDGNFDLIVMGSRGLSAFSRTFLGSVSNKVLNYSDADVLIVR